MKIVALLSLLLLMPGASFASGQRTIKPSKILEQDRVERSLEQLDVRASYLGSYGEWHLFAQTLTDASGGLPYDHTEAYRVKADGIEVLNGWVLAEPVLAREINPQVCPRPIFVDHPRHRIVISPAAEVKRRCIPE